MHQQIWDGGRGNCQLGCMEIACVEFFKNILRINEREAFHCIDCGPRPKVLVIDGIAMGILKTELHKYKHEIVQELANKSKKEFEGSNFRDRMFIKQTKNRLLLRKAVKKQRLASARKQ